MGLKDEMQVYDSAPVSLVTGETESYDSIFFPNVIRKRELEFIEQVLSRSRPKFILDFGCGGGWLSILLQKLGLDFVGMDISKNMVKNAKIVCPNSEFIVCDAMRLPFRSDVFDFIIGISILHHLDLRLTTDELKRVSVTKCTFLFMEPSLLNPLSAFGRKFFPMEAHTEGEKPYAPNNLKMALDSSGLKVEKLFTMFFFAFPAARVLKLVKLKPAMVFVNFAYHVEGVLEKIPFVRVLNSNIVVILSKKSFNAEISLGRRFFKILIGDLRIDATTSS